MRKFVLSAALALAISLSPTFTYAAGLSNSQIQSILSLLSSFGADASTIANVNAALSGTSAGVSGSPFCYTFNSDLTVGSNGGDVTALNQALTASGIDTSGNGASFTENSAADVVSFQAKNGIRQTGYVGPLTRTKLNALYGCSVPAKTGWTTYSSAVADFSLQYPSSWSYYEDAPTDFSFGPNRAETHGASAPGTTAFVVHIFSPGDEMNCSNSVCKYLTAATSLSDFLTATAAPIDPKQKTIMTLPAAIGGETAMAWTGYYPDIIDIKHGGKIYEIQRVYGNQVSRQEAESYFNAMLNSLNFVSKPAASSSVYAVTYPNGGEQLAVGTPVNVTWNGPTPDQVLHNSVDLIDGNGNPVENITYMATGNSWTWTPEAKIPSGNYKIQVGSSNAWDTSDGFFKIVNPTLGTATNPTIFVTVPEAVVGNDSGLTYKPGDSITVGWNDDGFNPKNIQIKLVAANQLPVVLGTPSAPARTSFIGALPSNLSAGTYSVSICDLGTPDNNVIALFRATQPLCGYSAQFNVVVSSATNR